MNRAQNSYIPSYKLNESLDSPGIAEVIESKNPKYPVGSIVTGPSIQWEERTVVDANRPLTILPRKAEHPNIPLSAHIGVLGMPVRSYL